MSDYSESSQTNAFSEVIYNQRNNVDEVPDLNLDQEIFEKL